MAIENIKQFFDRAKEDENLQQQLKELANKSAEYSMQALVEIAQAQGFAFGKKDLEAYFSDSAKNFAAAGELNEAELDAVAGGGVADWISLSICTLGLGCVASAVHRNASTGCPLDN